MVIAVYTDASRAATGMLDVLAIMIVRSINLRPRMWVYQFRELVNTSTTSFARSTAGDNHDIRFRLFRDSVLKHRLTRTERTGDKSGTTLNDRVHGIDRTNARLQQFEWTGFRLFQVMAFLTGHFWIIVTFTSVPFSSVRTAIVSLMVYCPAGTTDFTI